MQQLILVMLMNGNVRFKLVLAAADRLHVASRQKQINV